MSLLISTELGSRSLFSPFVRDSCNTESCQFLFLLFHTTQTLNSLDRLSPCGLQTTKRGGEGGCVGSCCSRANSHLLTIESSAGPHPWSGELFLITPEMELLGKGKGREEKPYLSLTVMLRLPSMPLASC